MIYSILCVVLIFVISYIWMILKSIAIRDKETKKLKFTFQDLHAGVFISKFFWSIACTIAVIYCISLIVPIVWMLYSSLKGEFDFRLDPFSLPNPLFFENYANVLEKLTVTTTSGVTYTVLDMLFNSILYAGINPFKFVFWLSSVAYVLSRFDFKFNKFLYMLGILIMMIPITGTLATNMMVQKALGLYDNMYAHFFVPPPTSFSGLNFMIFYAALKAIPMDYTEAARIDGANEYRIMYGIIIPMIIPTCLTIYILSFVGLWNGYEEILIWFPSTPNLAYGMYEFQYRATAGSAGAASQPEILAGLVLSMIPSLIIYLSSQKIMRSNFTVGGIKG